MDFTSGAFQLSERGDTAATSKDVGGRFGFETRHQVMGLNSSIEE